MTKITLQKNVLIHSTNAKTVKYNELEKSLNGINHISVSCVSCYMDRRVKKFLSLGFVVKSVIVPISETDELAFAEYEMIRN